MERFPACACAFLSGAEGSEVFGRFGDDVCVEFEFDAAFISTFDLDVEEDLRSAAWIGGGFVSFC